MAGQQAGNLNGRRDVRGRPTTSRVATGKGASWLDTRPGASIVGDTARVIAGDAALAAGLLPGAARGVWDMGKDAVEGVSFLAPLAHLAHPNATKRGAAWGNMSSAREGLVDYARNAYANPMTVVHDVEDGLRSFRAKVDPSVSPPADTLWGEAERNFNIGMNQGEAAVDAVTLLDGGAALKALAGLSKMSEAAKAAKMAKDLARFRARGYAENVARRFAEPYDGMGSHFWPRAKALPAWLGGGRLPRAISDSPFNVLKPRNISTGDMYELHFGVDPKYFGGKIGKDFRPGPGRWSGRELGWTKRDQLERLWYGSPKPLKTVVGGGIFGGTGALMDQIWNEGGQR